jgi:hypothetical protein
MECFSELEEKIGFLDSLKEFEFIRFWPRGHSFLLKMNEDYVIDIDKLVGALLREGYTSRRQVGKGSFKIDEGVAIIFGKEADCLYGEKDKLIRIQLKYERLINEDSPYARDRSVDMGELLGPLLKYLKILYGTEGLISTNPAQPAQNRH